MRAHPSWRRAGGVAAIVFAGAASIATKPPSALPSFRDGGATQEETASARSAPFTLVLTPTTPTAEVSGTVTLSRDLTAELASFGDQTASASLELTGTDLPRNESVDIVFRIDGPIPENTDGGAAGLGGGANSGLVEVSADGRTSGMTFGLDPGWTSFCVAGVPCSVRFHVLVGCVLTAGEVGVSGTVSVCVEAPFGFPGVLSVAGTQGIEVVLDSQGQDGFDGG